MYIIIIQIVKLWALLELLKEQVVRHALRQTLSRPAGLQKFGSDSGSTHHQKARCMAIMGTQTAASKVCTVLLPMLDALCDVVSGYMDVYA